MHVESVGLRRHELKIMHDTTWGLVAVVTLVGNTILRASAMCEAAVSEKRAGLQRRQVGPLQVILVGNREGEIGRWMSMNIRWNGT